MIDFNKVGPSVGTCEDVVDLAEHYDLMLDAVINHISVKSIWFQGFLRVEHPYSNYFITVDDTANLSEVFRPRALPLLTSSKPCDH